MDYGYKISIFNALPDSQYSLKYSLRMEVCRMWQIRLSQMQKLKDSLSIYYKKNNSYDQSKIDSELVQETQNMIAHFQDDANEMFNFLENTKEKFPIPKNRGMNQLIKELNGQ